MALQWLRRKQQKLKWVLWIVIIALSASMLLFFAGGPSGAAGTSLAANEIARVGDHTITAMEFRRLYGELEKDYRSFLSQNPDLAKQFRLGDRALGILVSQYAVLAEAERLGLRIAPSEFYEELKGVYGTLFFESGVFIGQERYLEMLRRLNVTVSEFEGELTRRIAQRKLRQLLTGGMQISDEEVRREFVDRNTESKVRYLAVDSREVAADLDEVKLKQYYDENIHKYQTGERRQVNFVSLRVSQDEVQLSQEEIAAATAPTQEGKQFRELQLRLEKSTEQARIQAEEIVAAARAGAGLSEAAQARGLQVVVSAPFGDEEPVPQSGAGLDFTAEVFQLGADAISDPFNTKPGEYLVAQLSAVLPAEAMAFETARATVETDYRVEKGRELALEKARQISAAARAGVDLAELARQEGLTVNTTEFFKRGDNIDETLKFSPILHDQVAVMELGDVSTPIRVTDYQIVFQLVEKSPVDEQRFEAEKDSLRRELSQQRTDDFFQSYVGRVVEGLYDNQGIEVNRELVDSISGQG